MKKQMQVDEKLAKTGVKRVIKLLNLISSSNPLITEQIA
jgi:hypothetical protein